MVSPPPFPHRAPSEAWLQRQNGWPHESFHEVVLILQALSLSHSAPGTVVRHITVPFFTCWMVRPKVLVPVHVHLFINPWHIHRRVTVVILCVNMLAATYLVYTSQVRFCRVVYGILRVLFMWLSLKMLRSNVLAWFSEHLLSSLDVELSMDKRSFNGFFSKRLMCRHSDSSNWLVTDQ